MHSFQQVRTNLSNRDFPGGASAKEAAGGTSSVRTCDEAGPGEVQRQSEQQPRTFDKFLSSVSRFH